MNIKVHKVKKTTLNYTVYQAIKEGILQGDIPEGEKLVETQMGKELGVSATPVREAFRMLATEGLIHLDPYKGAVVTAYSPSATLEATQCRQALECMALKLYMTTGDVNAGINELENMIKEAEETIAINDFVQISAAIHSIWIQGCKNTKIAELVAQLNTVILREANVSANDTTRRKAIIAEHKKMLRAMKNKNIALACEELAKHLENGFQYSKKQNKK